MHNVHQWSLLDTCILYADATALMCAHRQPDILAQRMASLKERAGFWFQHNNIKINDKTQRVIVSSNARLQERKNVRILVWYETLTLICYVG